MIGIFDRYTLWNAEYRMSLMRNFKLPSDGSGKHNSLEVGEGSGLACDEPECEGGKASLKKSEEEVHATREECEETEEDMKVVMVVENID